MNPPFVVLLTPNGRLTELYGVSNEALLAALRAQPPACIREQVESELLRRLDAWASGWEHG